LTDIHRKSRYVLYTYILYIKLNISLKVKLIYFNTRNCKVFAYKEFYSLYRVFGKSPAILQEVIQDTKRRKKAIKYDFLNINVAITRKQLIAGLMFI